MNFLKPRIIVSRCLGFDHCRFDGQIVNSPVIERMRDFVEIETVCPEVQIGLGIPRDSVRIIEKDGELRLMQTATSNDVTWKMREFVGSYLDEMKDVDGWILKTRSPSCGVKDVKVYGESGSARFNKRAAGFFGGAVSERFPNTAIEDDGRLRNFRIREHFFTKLYILRAFREIKMNGKMRDLIKFHSQNKYLLMAYNQTELRNLGPIVANSQNRPFQEIITLYEYHMLNALKNIPRRPATINVLQHVFGYFSKDLNVNERRYFLDELDKYRQNKIPLSVPTSILKSWLLRFDVDYLRDQTFFQPFPEELMDVADSGQGKNY